MGLPVFLEIMLHFAYLSRIVDDECLCKSADIGGIVGDHDDGDLESGLDPSELFSELPAQESIQSGAVLVQEQSVGCSEEGPGQSHSLFLPA